MAWSRSARALEAAVNVGRTGDNDDPFLGAIDDVRVYRRALSLAEIQADMKTPVNNEARRCSTVTPSLEALESRGLGRAAPVVRQLDGSG